MKSVALLFAWLVSAAGKETCGESKSPCSGKGTYASLLSQLGGAGAQTSPSKDLAVNNLKDFSVDEIDAAKSWVTYTQGGKSGGCKLDSIKCGDVKKLSAKVRANRRATATDARAPPRRATAPRPRRTRWAAPTNPTA